MLGYSKSSPFSYCGALKCATSTTSSLFAHTLSKTPRFKHISDSFPASSESSACWPATEYFLFVFYGVIFHYVTQQPWQNADKGFNRIVSFSAELEVSIRADKEIVLFLLPVIENAHREAPLYLHDRFPWPLNVDGTGYLFLFVFIKAPLELLLLFIAYYYLLHIAVQIWFQGR